MRKISESPQHLYQLLSAYKEAPGLVTWNDALKICVALWPSKRLNPQEFLHLSNLAARAGYLSGIALPKGRTKKYIREHGLDVIPSNFIAYRAITGKGLDFLDTYKKLEEHMKAIYPEDLKIGRLPPETITLQILGKPTKTGDEQWTMPVLFIPQAPPEGKPVTHLTQEEEP